ncbi:14288_t:CDS:2 [Dentiscutata erythropus]|uniref:14288_t:CDS:1 n=1 Tax=Dentiscutata erythropus TaxID=1348616 RepID=A0A9N9BFD1_9GLOM|nr:14288_t:CDS:2 [Dentiscutata erythropus]
MPSKFQKLSKLALLVALIIFYLLPTESYLTPRSKAKGQVKDGCTKLAKNILSSPSYDNVKACIKGFKYDAKRAKQMIDIAEAVFLDFYSLADQANEIPKNGSNFKPTDFKPIDLKKELNSLRDKKFKSDFEFMTTLRNLIADSRDLGVRFNQALASLTKRFDKWLIAEGTNQFAYRFDLPETSNISYTLLCSGKKRNLVRNWDINFLGDTDFDDSKSYFKKNCLYNSFQSAKNTSLEMNYNQTTASHSNNKTTKYQLEPVLDAKNTSLETNSNQTTTPQSNNQTTKSQLEPVVDTKDAHFYLVGDIGVAQITSVDFGFDALRDIRLGFRTLFKKKAKKLVIDLSNNPGGAIDAAQVISFLLIPPNNFSFFPRDMKITNISEPLVGPGSFFDPDELSPFPSGGNFSSIENFIGKNFVKIGNKTLRYSNKFDYKLTRNQLKVIENNKEYPWTRNNTIILTNGYCGSACALISQYLAEIGQFPTVAVGGLYNTSLSFASFTGGEFFSYDGSVKLKDIPSLPVSGELQFTASKSYSILEKNEVLDFSYRPSKYRLYYDDKSARDPSLLWSKAADFL